MMKLGTSLLCLMALFASMATFAEDSTDSGFLQDYSKLQPVEGTNIRLFSAENAYTQLKNYKAVMIDQPEFVIAADSKYRGVKPDELKALADSMRKSMSDAVSKNLPVVDRPGPGVLYVRMAASNVHLKKKKRGILSYTPAGFVVTEATRAAQDMEQKIVLQDMVLEMEIMDSESQEVLLAMVDDIGKDVKQTPSESWAEGQKVLGYWSERFSCRLSNATRPRDQWQDCIGELPE